jgi:hypothetical protein
MTFKLQSVLLENWTHVGVHSFTIEEFAILPDWVFD